MSADLITKFKLYGINKLLAYDYNSPIGILQIIYDENFIFSISFENSIILSEEIIYNANSNSKAIETCLFQLDEYFSRKRKIFNVPIKPLGTDFQKKVWLQLKKIPFGDTVSYKYIATQIGNSNSARAVGLANNKNPIPIIIPCHRVVATNGHLTGFGGEIWRKEWLLTHEVS